VSHWLDAIMTLGQVAYKSFDVPEVADILGVVGEHHWDFLLARLLGSLSRMLKHPLQ